MSDKELLELAARAAGLTIKWGDVFIVGDDEVDCSDIPYIVGVDEADIYWNPLTDDGDALRLAVKLKFHVVCPGIVRDEDGRLTLCDETSEPGDYAATRRAIVRAAAALSSNIKEEKNG
jgi:hypothetical protein